MYSGYSGEYVACACGVIMFTIYGFMIREGRKAFAIFDIERMWRGLLSTSCVSFPYNICLTTSINPVSEHQTETYGSVPTEVNEESRERSDSAGELSTKDNIKLVAQRIFTGANSAEADRGKS